MYKSGIYKITCSINQKIYIGCASYIDQRKHYHLNKLAENKHTNRKLQAAYNKYGKDNFIFEVIEYIAFNSDKNILKHKLIQREQYYLDTLLFANINDNRFDKLGFNLVRNVNLV